MLFYTSFTTTCKDTKITTEKQNMSTYISIFFYLFKLIEIIKDMIVISMLKIQYRKQFTGDCSDCVNKDQT